MKNVTLTQIKELVIEKGGSYKRLTSKLNGGDTYEVNNKKYTKSQIIEAFKMGDL